MLPATNNNIVIKEVKSKREREREIELCYVESYDTKSKRFMIILWQSLKMNVFLLKSRTSGKVEKTFVT